MQPAISVNALNLNSLSTFQSYNLHTTFQLLFSFLYGSAEINNNTGDVVFWLNNIIYVSLVYMCALCREKSSFIVQNKPYFETKEKTKFWTVIYSPNKC